MGYQVNNNSNAHQTRNEKFNKAKEKVKQSPSYGEISAENKDRENIFNEQQDYSVTEVSDRLKSLGISEDETINAIIGLLNANGDEVIQYDGEIQPMLEAIQSVNGKATGITLKNLNAYLQSGDPDKLTSYDTLSEEELLQAAADEEGKISEEELLQAAADESKEIDLNTYWTDYHNNYDKNNKEPYFNDIGQLIQNSIVDSFTGIERDDNGNLTDAGKKQLRKLYEGIVAQNENVSISADDKTSDDDYIALVNKELAKMSWDGKSGNDSVNLTGLNVISVEEANKLLEAQNSQDVQPEPQTDAQFEEELIQAAADEDTKTLQERANDLIQNTFGVTDLTATEQNQNGATIISGSSKSQKDLGYEGKATQGMVAIANKFWEGNEAALNQISQISTYKQFKSAVENQTNGYVDLTSDENKDVKPQVGDAVYMDDPNGGNFHEGVVVGYTDDGKAIVAEANSANSEIKGGSVFRVYDFNSDSEKSIKGFFPIGERTQTQQTTEETTEESTEQTSDEVQEESDDSKKKPLN